MPRTETLVERIRRTMNARCDEAWSDVLLTTYLPSSRNGVETPMVVDGQRELSPSEFADRVKMLAGFLSSEGLEEGDVVTVMLPNWWEALIVCHAVIWAGGIVNPVVPIYREYELSFMLSQARPKFVFLPDIFRDFAYRPMMERAMQMAQHLPRLVIVRPNSTPLSSSEMSFKEACDRETLTSSPNQDPNDPVLLLYTSGTTGNPKGVLHTHNTLGYENRSIVEFYNLEAGRPIFMPSPVTHVTGFLYGVLLPVMLGAPVVLQDIWDPDRAFELVETFSCQFSLGATPFLQGLLDAYQRQETRSVRSGRISLRRCARSA